MSNITNVDLQASAIPVIESNILDAKSMTQLDVPEQLKKNVTIVTDKGKSLALEATGDQIIVLQDKFRTGYECKTCDGEGYIEGKCGACNGEGIRGEALCNVCCPKNLLQSGGYRMGGLICPNCKGMGSTIIAPDIAQRKATSGTIVSIGPECEYFVPGQRVLYSIFAGTEIEFKQKAVVRIMHEHEVMCRLWGVGNFGDFETISK